jgi:AcrR family transcriptional regulator
MTTPVPPAEAPAEPPGPRRYHHGDLRAALLAAAEAELALRGIEGFSLRGVAKRAGVSHAAPAHHFPDTRALLTALAAEGFTRLLATQRAREGSLPQPDRLVAAGLGYIEFATTNPALFRLIFASERPDRDAPALKAAATAADDHLLANIAELHGANDSATDPAIQADAIAAWGIVHGISDLIQAGCLPELAALPPAERDAFLAPVIARALVR